MEVTGAGGKAGSKIWRSQSMSLGFICSTAYGGVSKELYD